MSKGEIQNALVDLYFEAKIRKWSDMDNITDDIIKKEKEKLYKLPLMDIINYIKNSIEILSEIKAQEKYDEKILEDEKKEKYKNINDLENDPNGLKLFEGMLVKAESDIRSHIRVRNKLNNIYILKLKFIYIFYWIDRTRIKT